MEQNNQEERKPSTGLKVIVLVVLVILLVIGILLPIKIVPGAFSSITSTISSLFTRKEKITLSASKTDIRHGDTFSLRWNGTQRTDGSYTLQYACNTGVRLETSINRPREVIPCNYDFYFSPSTNSIDLAGYSDTKRYADANITLGFLKNGGSNVEKIADITLMVTNPALAESLPNGAQSTTASTTTSTTTKSTATAPVIKTKPQTPSSSYNPYGLADLDVRLIATGYLASNGVFISTLTPPQNSQTAIKFRIANVGDKSTGTWTFVANLPSVTDPRYVSPVQMNLNPGDSIEYVLGFEKQTSGVALIDADPANILKEYTKANNILRITFPNGNGTYLPSSQPDLSIRILETGIINRSTGQFSQTSSVGSSDRAGIRFEVRNDGRTSTGIWQFRASLPSADSNSSTYISGDQAALAPGERAIFTIGFDNLAYQGGNTATITVDSTYNVSEYNENNNTASVTVVRY